MLKIMLNLEECTAINAIKDSTIQNLDATIKAKNDIIAIRRNLQQVAEQKLANEQATTKKLKRIILMHRIGIAAILAGGLALALAF